MPDLPPPLAAALDALGVRTLPPPRRDFPRPWLPAYPGEEPPF